MSFKNKSTVLYKVWFIEADEWDEEWTVNNRREAGVVSVRTDRQNKSGQWDVTNKALLKALDAGHFLRAHSNDVLVGGEDDGVLFVDEIPEIGGRPLLQLEYERHHDVPEKSSSLFSEPGAKDMSRSNPLSFSSLSTGEKVGIAAAGAAVLGVIGYAIWKSQQSASTAASLPVVQTPMPGTTPAPGTPNYGVVSGGQVYDPNLGGSGTPGGQVYDPNLGGSGAMPVYSGVAPGNPAPGSLIGGG